MGEYDLSAHLLIRINPLKAILCNVTVVLNYLKFQKIIISSKTFGLHQKNME